MNGEGRGRKKERKGRWEVKMVEERESGDGEGWGKWVVGKKGRKIWKKEGED
jgi:hypothetical protein